MTGIGPKIGHPIENESGEEIPPMSVVLVTGVKTSDDGLRTWSTVKQYDGSAGNLMVTGNVTIPDKIRIEGESVNGRGTAYIDNMLYVSIDPDAADPEAGESWGPVDGKWTLGTSGSGFVAQGFSLPDITPKRALFQRAPGGRTSLIPYIITEVGEGDANVAVYRRLATTVKGKRAENRTSPYWLIDSDADEEDLNVSVMRGISFTGQCVLVATIGGEKCIVAGFGGEIFHSAWAVEAIDADSGGLIALAYMPASGGVAQSAEVTAINTLDRGLAESDDILLATFSDAMQTVKIIVLGCPA